MIPLIASKHTSLAQRKRLLFVCSGNACRSQMAEGWTNFLFGAQLQALSAGVEAHGLDPHAVSVMAERGIDISRQRSKAFDAFASVRVDLIVTLSDRAASHLRSLRVPQPVIHIPCLSPANRLRIGETSLSHYREIRDELYDIVRHLIVCPQSRFALEGGKRHFCGASTWSGPTFSTSGVGRAGNGACGSV